MGANKKGNHRQSDRCSITFLHSSRACLDSVVYAQSRWATTVGWSASTRGICKKKKWRKLFLDKQAWKYVVKKTWHGHYFFFLPTRDRSTFIFRLELDFFSLSTKGLLAVLCLIDARISFASPTPESDLFSFFSFYGPKFFLPYFFFGFLIDIGGGWKKRQFILAQTDAGLSFYLVCSLEQPQTIHAELFTLDLFCFLIFLTIFFPSAVFRLVVDRLTLFPISFLLVENINTAYVFSFSNLVVSTRNDVFSLVWQAK